MCSASTLRRELVRNGCADRLDGLAAALVGEDRGPRRAGCYGSCGFDGAEIVMQVFEPCDPVRITDEGFDTDAGRPAEMIARGFGDECIPNNVDIKKGPMHALPSEAAGAVEQPAGGRRPAETAAGGAEIFHIVRQCFGHAACLGYRHGTALDA